jgi:hypothetical protein
MAAVPAVARSVRTCGLCGKGGQTRSQSKGKTKEYHLQDHRFWRERENDWEALTYLYGWDVVLRTPLICTKCVDFATVFTEAQKDQDFDVTL